MIIYIAHCVSYSYPLYMWPIETIDYSCKEEARNQVFISEAIL